MKILTEKDQEKLYSLLDTISSNNRVLYKHTDSEIKDCSDKFLSSVSCVCDICEIVFGFGKTIAFCNDQIQEINGIMEQRNEK